jgi:hypothetical protein
MPREITVHFLRCPWHPWFHFVLLSLWNWQQFHF